MKQMRIILLLIMLVGSSLACKLGSRVVENPLEPIAVTTEAVEELLDKVVSAQNSALSGVETELVITENEVTSLVVFQLQELQSQPVENIQVFLRDGQVLVHGLYRDSGFSFPLEVIAEPSVTESGQLKIKLVIAKIGPMAAPDVLRNQAQSMIDEAVSQAINDQSGENFKVTFVEIADGSIKIRGYYP